MTETPQPPEPDPAEDQPAPDALYELNFEASATVTHPDGTEE